MAELAIRLEDLDSRVAVTGSMLALLDSQQAVLRQQLASAASESAEEEWCRRALLACEAKQLQVSALLARQSLLARPQQHLLPPSRLPALCTAGERFAGVPPAGQGGADSAT